MLVIPAFRVLKQEDHWSWRPAWVTQCIQGKPGLFRKTLAGHGGAHLYMLTGGRVRRIIDEFKASVQRVLVLLGLYNKILS